MGRIAVVLLIVGLFGAPGLQGQHRAAEHHSLRPYCPSPADQGAGPTCQTYAAVYALSIAENVRKGLTDKVQKDRERYSASFLYHLLQGPHAGAERPVSVQEVLDAAVTSGNLPLADFPEAPQWNVQADAAQLDAACQYRAVGAWQLMPAPSWTEEEDRLKRCLKAGIPVVIQVALWRPFIRLKSKTYRGKGLAGRDYLGVHSLVVIGFDDRSRTFEVLNSWGKDWGKEGLGQIHTQALRQMLLSAFIILPAEAEEELVKAKQIAENFRGNAHNSRPVGHNRNIFFNYKN